MRGNLAGNLSPVCWQQRPHRIASEITGGPPASRSPSQRFDPLPDWSESWYRYAARKAALPTASTVPSRAPPQRADPLPDLSDSWFRQRPRMLPPTAGEPLPKQGGQRHDALPVFADHWWRRQPAKRNPAAIGASTVPPRRPSQRFDSIPVSSPAHWQPQRKAGTELFWFKQRRPRVDSLEAPDFTRWYARTRAVPFPPTPKVAYRRPPWPWPEVPASSAHWHPARKRGQGLQLPWLASRPQQAYPPLPAFADLWWQTRTRRRPDEITASVVPTRRPSQRLDPLPDFGDSWWQLAARMRMRSEEWYVALLPDDRPMNWGRASDTQAVTGG